MLQTMYEILKNGRVANSTLPDSCQGFSQLLSQFHSITLEQMTAVALQKRIDTKYILSENGLLTALASLKDDFYVLDINGTRLNDYHTVYFDTADFSLYQAHHAGSRPRYKVRSRKIQTQTAPNQQADGGKSACCVKSSAL